MFGLFWIECYTIRGIGAHLSYVNIVRIMDFAYFYRYLYYGPGLVSIDQYMGLLPSHGLLTRPRDYGLGHGTMDQAYSL